ncbi:MAG TPA: hypothetical protein VD969_27710 [Symbiobacteriaceae bacterium]|nr:hypothetical protein [Symbiobacteriaceae bacterium]
MDCPVCPRTEIPDDVAVCPSCGVDLTPLLRAKELGAAEYNEALRLVEVGATEVAIGKVAAALALDPSLVQARVLLGKLLWNRGQAQAAVTQWEQAASGAKEDPEIPRLLDAAARKLGRERLTRLAVPAATLLVVLLLALTNFLSYRWFANRLDGMATQFGGDLDKVQASLQDLSEQFATYRATHNHTDAEYAEAVAQANLRRQEAEAERAAAAAYRAAHSHTDGEYDRAWAEVAALRRQVEEIERTMSALQQPGDVRP